ncbi:terminase large subunit domain-containing protein [Insolitispirillum peregrinum]|uniref:Terminase-like family protein n=1 Tax=Insolitispirillum peregrinum TaxID=80876 RepID=A0A1N7LRY1_9PROT|nr:terminase family protein [Insolitispirillum peregrinum]SIS76633.1 Terminase-like family protein [Insolitispirillum peregrinum]
MSRGRKGSPEWVRAEAHAMYLDGLDSSEIAAVLLSRHKLDVSPRTVRNWIKAGNWGDALRARQQTPGYLEAQINRLARKANPTQADAQKIAMLTKSLDRLRRVAPKPRPVPTVRHAVSADLLALATSPDYGLYKYQLKYLIDPSRFLLCLKSRQIGFSYVVALKVVLRAMAGRQQLVVSASQRQASKFLNYVRHHCGKLGILLDDDKADHVRIGGTSIYALPPNFRTIQGDPGDVVFDEFAWVMNQKRVWEALVPSITAVGGTLEVLSTPFLPGSLFWRMATNHEGKYDQFTRLRISIHDAIADGMPLPGGIEDLRSLFDADSWAMMYELQWAEDGTALLSWADLQACTTPADAYADTPGRWGGLDLGRTNDRTWLSIVGEVEGARGPLFPLVDWADWKGVRFDDQRALVLDACAKHPGLERLNIDGTGIGWMLGEQLQAEMPDIAVRRTITQQYKAKIATNLARLVERRQVLLPPDPGLLAQMHAVKKIAGANTIRYDADHTADGHADAFWSLALALDGMAPGAIGGQRGGSLTVECW